MAYTERYIRADAAGGGNGTTDTNSGANGAWTLAEAITNTAAGMRMNWRAGTYANAGSSRTFATAGTTTAPIWWRCFNSNPGDLDLSLSAQWTGSITFTTARALFTGAHQLITGASFVVTGNVANNLVTSSGGSVWFLRCRFDNQQANVGSGAWATSSAAGGGCINCWFKATTTAIATVTLATGGELIGCYVTGGAAGINASGSQMVIRNTVINAPATDGILMASAGFVKVIGCSLYSGTNGIKCTTLTAGDTIEDCIFSTFTTAINNTTGTNTNLIFRIANSYYACTNTETGFGDSPAFFELTETNDPFTSAATGDFSLVAGALSRASALPGQFENVTTVSYTDRGAAQHKDTGGLFIPVE